MIEQLKYIVSNQWTPRLGAPHSAIIGCDDSPIWIHQNNEKPATNNNAIIKALYNALAGTSMSWIYRFGTWRETDVSHIYINISDCGQQKNSFNRWGSWDAPKPKGLCMYSYNLIWCKIFSDFNWTVNYCY